MPPAAVSAAAADADRAPPIAEVPSNASREARLYEEFTRVPIITRAVVRADARGDVHLTVTTAQHNLPANSKRQTVRAAVVPAAAVAAAAAAADNLAAAAIVAPLPTEPAPSALTSVSPSGRRMLVARAHAGGAGGGGGGKGGAGAGGEGTLLELWEGGRLLKELLAPRALHGPVVNDSWFSRGAAWSPDESRVCYVAEAPPTQRTPEWGKSVGAGQEEEEEKKTEADEHGGGGNGNGNGKGGGGASAAAAPRGWRGVGEAEEDWGELNTGKRPPALFVLDTADWSVGALPGVTGGADACERHSCGQPAWTPGGEGVVFVAWPHAPPNFPATQRRLGIVFCYNRPCALYYAPVPSAARKKSGGDQGTPPAPAAAAARLISPPSLLSAATPLFTPDGARLVFFSHEAAASSGVHNATTALHVVDWNGPEEAAAEAAAAQAAAKAAPKPLVPVVRRPSSPGAFPGLYPALPVDNPFVERGRGRAPFLLLTTQWGSMTAVAAVDLASGAASAVSGGGGARDAAQGSWSFQGAAGGLAVALHSSPSQPPRLMLARADPAAAQRGEPWQWAECGGGLSADLSGLPLVASALAGLETRVARLSPPPAGDSAGLPVESLVTGPRAAFFWPGDGGGGEAAVAGAAAAAAGAAAAAAEAPTSASGPPPTPAPAILFPHGGPHACTPSAYYPPAAFFASMGYLFVAVNYRGSVGFGEDAVQSLPGKVGEQDVADCLAALEQLCCCRGTDASDDDDGPGLSVAAADAARCAVIGGSHGGFLAGHLIGQHPGRFRAAGLRNPVLNVALMVGVTDIPDWCYIEAFGCKEGQKRYSPAPTADDLRVFLEKSPAAHLDRVTTPLVMLLGAKDRRVPAEDGRRYLAALRGRGGGAGEGGEGASLPPPPPATRLLVFPEDTHALDRPQTEFEQWVSLAAWLREHGCWAGAGLD